MLEFDERPNRLRRLRVPALATAAVAAMVAWLVFNPPSFFDPPPEAVRIPRSTGEVRVASLTESFSTAGNLGAAREWAIAHPGQGTITEIAAQGEQVSTGTVLYRVDDVPTVAIVGPIPAYRTMTVDSVGDDVLQLEQALVELGYDSLGLLAVDGTYTTYTESLVALWQEDVGIPITGRVDFGVVVFVPEGLDVGEVVARTGDPANGGPLLLLQSPDQHVQFEVAINELDSLPTGSMVEVQLPDRSIFEAEVIDMINAGSGLWTLTATPTEVLEQATADATPVDISWDVTLAEDTVVVSAGAIRRLDTGDLVVEVVHTSDLDTEFSPVQVGHQSGSTVELLSGPPVGTVIIEP